MYIAEDTTEDHPLHKWGRRAWQMGGGFGVGIGAGIGLTQSLLRSDTVRANLAAYDTFGGTTKTFFSNLNNSFRNSTAARVSDRARESLSSAFDSIREDVTPEKIWRGIQGLANRPKGSIASGVLSGVASGFGTTAAVGGIGAGAMGAGVVGLLTPPVGKLKDVRNKLLMAGKIGSVSFMASPVIGAAAGVYNTVFNAGVALGKGIGRGAGNMLRYGPNIAYGLGSDLLRGGLNDFGVHTAAKGSSAIVNVARMYAIAKSLAPIVDTVASGMHQPYEDIGGNPQMTRDSSARKRMEESVQGLSLSLHQLRGRAVV